VMDVCCRAPIRIGHLKDFLPLTPAPDFTHWGGARVAQHDATQPEFGHRKLRNDFGLWRFGYV
jgi:hypothetical protein